MVILEELSPQYIDGWDFGCTLLIAYGLKNAPWLLSMLKPQTEYQVGVSEALKFAIAFNRIPMTSSEAGMNVA